MKNHTAHGRVQLTAAERLLLINQFAILERLDPGRRHEYAVKRGIVERGETEHYDVLLDPCTPAAGRQNQRHVDDDVNRLTIDRGGALTPW